MSENDDHPAKAAADDDDQPTSGLGQGPQDQALALRELEEALAKRENRISHLLGERTQLIGLLRESSEKIQALSKDLGRYEQQLESAGPGAQGRGWLAHGHRLAEKLQGAGDLIQRMRQIVGKDMAAAKPAAPSANPTKAPDIAPLVPFAASRTARPILAVSLFGLSAEEIDAILPSIDTICERQQLTPLLLTDNDAFEPLRARRMAFEYLPPREDQQRFEPKSNWDLYVQRRLAIIRRKWNPAKVIAFGTVGQTVMQLWLASPFETSPIPTALGSDPSRPHEAG